MRASKLLHRILKFINYANLFKINEKCYFSVISWPILILFVLSDRAWCGLQNFYTEFWNALLCKFIQIYSKSMKKCYFSVISWPILILFVLADRACCGASKLLHRILKFINYANLCKFIQNQWKNATSLFLGRFWFCLIYLIGLGGGFKTSTQNFEINYANLCKFIQNQRKMLLLYFTADFDSVCFIW